MKLFNANCKQQIVIVVASCLPNSISVTNRPDRSKEFSSLHVHNKGFVERFATKRLNFQLH